MKKLYALSLAACLVLAASAFAQKSGSDPLSGTWVGDWGPSAADRNQVTVELKWDGTALSGTVNPGPNAVPLRGPFRGAGQGARRPGLPLPRGLQDHEEVAPGLRPGTWVSGR